MRIPEQLSLDFLHQVIEEEFSRKLKLWFVGSNADDVYCLEDSISAIDSAIFSVMLPHDFPKKSRSIHELCKWKAHEKEIFLFHIGLPILRKFLPAEHFFHYSLFVAGVRLLTNDRLTEEDRQLAEVMLDSYMAILGLWKICMGIPREYTTYMQLDTWHTRPLIVEILFCCQPLCLRE